MNFLLVKVLGWIPALKRLHMNLILVHSSLCTIFAQWFSRCLIMVIPLCWNLTDTDDGFLKSLEQVNDREEMTQVACTWSHLPLQQWSQDNWHCWLVFSTMNSLLSQPPFQGLWALWKGPAFLHFLANSSSKLKSFLKNLLFYWSIVGVKNCVNFRYTAKWFSYMYTFIYQ